MKFLPLIFANLRRHKSRTILTVLSILVAFLLYGMLCTIKEAFTAGVSMAHADRVIVRHRVSLIMLLPAAYQRRIESVDGVDKAVSMTWFNGIYRDDPRNFFGSFPVDPEPFFSVYPEYVLPPEQMEAWKAKRTGAVVGRQLADRFGWKIGDHVPITSPIWPRTDHGAWEFDIVGIYDGVGKAADTSAFFFRYDYFDESRIHVRGNVGWFVVRIHDPDRATEISAAIDKEFENSPAETKAEAEGAFAAGFVQQMGNMGAILIAVLSAVFFTILLVAGNTMAQSVRERVGEFGTLKAMGFTSGGVLWLVLAESCLLSGLGGLAGLLTAWLITLGGSPIPSVLPIFQLPMRNLLWGTVLVGGLGILTGLPPALHAMRLRIAVALRRNA